MRMPQLDNKELIGRIIKATTFVIGRRTSETYANVMIGNAIKELSKKYNFLEKIKIRGSQYTEFTDSFVIDPDIEEINCIEVGKATKEFIEKVTSMMGKNAGYYFIKEIKEDLPYEYEQSIKKFNIDLDLLQFQFITDIKLSIKTQIKNIEILSYSLRIISDILDRELGKNKSYSIISELVERLNTNFEVFKYVTINDIRAIQGVNLISIEPEVNSMDPKDVGTALQKLIQELHNYFGEKTEYSFITRFKNYFNNDYLFKLEEMGVNLDIIELKKEIVTKNVLKTLVNVLSDSSNTSYSIMLVDSVLRKFEKKYSCLKHIKIDNMLFLEGKDEVIISPEIETIQGYELGRAIQSVIEDIAGSLGKNAGLSFIQKFKRRLGKAFVLRIEKLGVNLHMIELKQNLI
jgi:hypothetical protein